MAAEGGMLWTTRHIEGMRQWGRDRMAAEGCRPLVVGFGAVGVNGAATGWPRKAVGRMAASVVMPRVNGAATGWPRKVGGRHALVRWLHASMGPRPDGRGRCA